MVLVLRVPATENLVPPLCSRLSSTASTRGIVIDVDAPTRGFLGGDFHGEGVLHNTYFCKGKTYAYWGIWANYDHECFSMLYIRPTQWRGHPFGAHLQRTLREWYETRTWHLDAEAFHPDARD